MGKFWLGVATIYVACGLLFSASMSRAIPAVNWMGAAYYGAVWPVWPLGVAIGHNIAPIPNWAFTFEDQPHD